MHTGQIPPPSLTRLCEPCSELVKLAKSWTIVGKDLLSVVSCKEPYEWRQVGGRTSSL